MKVSVLTNIPNPYNRRFFDHLSRELDLTVRYLRRPEDEGRAWSVPLREFETVGTWGESGWSDFRRAVGRSDASIISGSWAEREVLELLFLRRRPPTYFWAERPHDGRWFVDVARRHVVRRFDGVLAIGSLAAGSYGRAAPAVPVMVLPYVTDPPQDLGAGPRDRIGYVGSLIYRKGVDVALEALGRSPLLRGTPVDIVGDGPDRAELVARASALGLDVTWHGSIANDDLPRLQCRWRLQLVPSRYDGWGVVVQEALQAGVPVISTPATGAAVDLVSGRGCGAVVELEVGAWAAAMENLIKAPMAPMSKRARDVGVRTSSRNAARWLRQVLESPRAAQVGRSFVDEALVDAEGPR